MPQAQRELRARGHDVTARNRSCLTDDPVLSRLDEFASILFIGLSGDSVFSTSDPAVVTVTPELRPEQESYANTLYDQIVELIA